MSPNFQVVGPEYVLQLHNPKAVVDVMLGAIAVTSGARTLEKYIGDMIGRKQDKDRLEEVEHALLALCKKTDSEKNIHENLKKAREMWQDLAKGSKQEATDIDALAAQLDELRLIKPVDFPEEYICPITQRVMREPVFADDGHSYEKAAITMWLEKSDASPLTGETLESKKPKPNVSLKKGIETFHSKNKDQFTK